MGSNVEGLIREGVAAYKAGRRDEAIKLLGKATELDERNEEAWMWLSAVVDTLENQLICLENVIAINPNNTRAAQGLESIRRQLAKKQTGGLSVPPPAPPAPAPASPSPFDLNAPVSNPSDLAQFEQRRSAAAEPPAAGGYHGSGKHVQLPSEDEYDAWVEGLGLGSEPRSQPAAPPSSDAFDLDSGPFQQADDSFLLDLDVKSPASEPASYAEMISPEPAEEEYSAGGRFDPFALPQSNTYEEEYDSRSAKAQSAPAPAARTAPTAEDDPFANLDAAGGSFSSASPFATETLDEAFQAEDDLKEFLNYIPDEIKATRLPGQRAVPRLLTFGLVALSGGIVRRPSR
jgi:tetratricopeptide (TPR) repeat protein